MASRPSNRQGLRDAAALLPVVAALLLLPPLIRIFATPAVPGGIPSIVLYIFGVWTAVILVALLIALQVDQPEDEPADSHAADGQ